MAIPAHKTEYFIIENSNLQKKANTATENSVFDPNQTETSFYMILKQQDDRYLIDEFATGL